MKKAISANVSSQLVARQHNRVKKGVGLVAGAILAGALFVSAGSVNADEVQSQSAQPQSVATVQTAASQAQTNVSAEQATTQTPETTTPVVAETQPTTAQAENTTPVEIDNSTVEQAADEATKAGVEVTYTGEQDYGVAKDQQEVASKQEEIQADQEQQVQNLNNAAKESAENTEAFTTAKKEVDTNNKFVDDAKKEHDKYINVKTTDVGKGNTKEDYAKITATAKDTYEQNVQEVKNLEKALSDYLNSNAFKAEMSYNTQNVDNLTFGESVMNAKVDSKTGALSLTHDMNDGFNESLGNLGTGTLNGKANWHSDSNHDGTQTITIDSVELYDYVYTNHRPSQAVDNNAEFIIKDQNDNVIYTTGAYNVNNSATFAINKTAPVNKSVTLKGNGDVSDVLEILKVDDNWIYNTHGQVAVKFTTENYEPAKIELVKLTQPEEPAPVKAEYHGYKLAVENPKPTTPTPGKGEVTPTPEPAQPTYTQAALPETGDASMVQAGFAGMASIFSALGLAWKRKNS